MEQITARVGEEFTLSLEEESGTGYIWEAHFDEHLLSLKEKRFEPFSPTAIGSGGMATFTFIPLKSGETNIMMEYKRPWEEEVGEERTFHITVKK